MSTVGPKWVGRRADSVRIGEVVKGVGIVRAIVVDDEAKRLVLSGTDGEKRYHPMQIIHVQMFGMGI